jgi:hypothetical protein
MAGPFRLEGGWENGTTIPGRCQPDRRPPVDLMRGGSYFEPGSEILPPESDEGRQDRERDLMIERDYIMRMIAMLSAVIAKVLHLKYARDYPVALEEVNKGFRSILGLNGDDLDAFSESQLLEMFGRDPELAPVRLYALGVLLMEREELQEGQGRGPGLFRGWIRALDMLLEAFHAAGGEQEPGHRERIGALLERLGGFELPEPTLMRLAEFYESTGQYAKSEDTYYELMERVPSVSARLHGFYDRILRRTDEDLERGNLPRREVLEGIRKLRS